MPSEASAIASTALRRAIIGTLLLGVMKTVGALATGSGAVGASAADALTDALVSGANLVLVRAASAPPDDGHPFGHGKAEALLCFLKIYDVRNAIGMIHKARASFIVVAIINDSFP